MTFFYNLNKTKLTHGPLHPDDVQNQQRCSFLDPSCDADRLCDKIYYILYLTNSLLRCSYFCLSTGCQNVLYPLGA